MKTLYKLLVLSLLSVTSSFAQQTRRIEIPLPAYSETFFTIPIGKQGVLLLSQTSKNTYVLSRFSTDLERLWTIDGNIDEKLDYVSHSFDGKNVFLLFSKFESNVYQVVKVYIGPGFIESYEIYSVDKVKISEFKAFKDNVYIAGDVRNQPIILYTNLASRQTKVLPSAVNGEAEIQAIDIDTLHNRINISYAVRKGKSSHIVVKSYNEDGRQDLQVIVEPDEAYSLINGKLLMLNDSVQLMLGTYGFKGNQVAGSIPVSQGMYISKVMPDEVLDPVYYSFTDFKNFFNYLSPRELEKMERRIAAKKEKGEYLKLNNYRLLVHDIIRQKDQYIIVAEAFYPDYRYNNNAFNPYGFGSPFMNSFYNPWGWGWGSYGMLNPSVWGWGGRSAFYNSQRQVFDGWIYTHAIVAGFDFNGKLLWDNSIVFKEVKTRSLHEKVKASIEDDGKMTLLYTHKGKMIKKVIQRDKVLEEDQVSDIETQQTGDRVRSNDNEDAEFWYDNYFVAWGTQRISGESGRRNIFYLTKITF